MNSVIDIGHSAYSQVQKLKGHEIDYEETEDEIENEAKEFFKKSSENAKFDSKSKKVSRIYIINCSFCCDLFHAFKLVFSFSFDMI